MGRLAAVRATILLLSVLAPGCAIHLDGEDLDVGDPSLVDPVSIAVAPDEVPASSAAPTVGPNATSDCALDVIADAQVAWAADREHPADARAVLATEHSEALGDLDGDGALEFIVVNEPLCGVTGNCPLRLYLSGSGCPALALDTFAASVWRSADGGRVPYAIESFSKGGCAGLAGEWAAHRFVGTRYVVTESATCGCPDEDESGLSKEPSRPAECPG